MTYNQQDLINAFSECGYTKVASKQIIEDFIGVMFNILSNGNNIKLYEFGKFEVIDRAARVGRNPKTGEEIAINPKKSVKFIVSKILKESVNS